MKTFVYMGANARNTSGTSWKAWKIQRKGKVLQAWWGPAQVVKRKLKPNYRQSCEWRHTTEASAVADEIVRIESKLKEGYKRSRAGGG